LNDDRGRGLEARSIRLSGHVQGVGFRPFVYRIAQTHGVAGWVQNQLGEVEVLAQAAPSVLDRFQRDLVSAAPALSRPVLEAVRERAVTARSSFEIRVSDADREPRVHVPPDYYTCDDCVGELLDPDDRRFRYPFVNCTQCGPRYTLICSMPYDRANTSMASFPLCAACRREYEDPADRRFHAEPIACPVCGPSLTFRDQDGRQADSNEQALEHAVRALADGAIMAVKGVGGYHLMCDAARDDSIARLRAAKPRPHKPLAIMVPVTGDDGLAAVRTLVRPGPGETELLLSPARPIVLMRKQRSAAISKLVAPGLAEVGVMLPYSPLHHLLLAGSARPLVATSANISGEPVLTEAVDVEQRIGDFVDVYLHHDRPIVRPADDSVYRPAAGRPRPIRLGRGRAPVEMTLRRALPRPILAVGGHMKNTVALAWEQRMVISPHIGDMDAARSISVFAAVIEDLQALYGKQATGVVCDAHRQYATSRWARRSGLPVTEVSHHHAHAAVAARDWPDDETGLVFTWDGVGLGPDGNLWGGEALFGAPGRWLRAATFRSFRLPGGERAGREPWRSAAGICWESGIECPVAPPGSELLSAAWSRGLNAPRTTAVGRLFDAAAALTGLVSTASFEGQGPMYLEAISDTPGGGIPLPLSQDEDGLLISDWQPLLTILSNSSRPRPERAAAFHDTLVRAALDQARALRKVSEFQRVGLSGGVFQNRLLTEHLLERFTADGFSVTIDAELPVNDGGLCAGQIVEHAARLPRPDTG